MCRACGLAPFICTKFSLTPTKLYRCQDKCSSDVEESSSPARCVSVSPLTFCYFLSGREILRPCKSAGRCRTHLPMPKGHVCCALLKRLCVYDATVTNKLVCVNRLFSEMRRRAHSLALSTPKASFVFLLKTSLGVLSPGRGDAEPPLLGASQLTIFGGRCQ